MINIMDVALHILRGCGEFNSKWRYGFKVLRCHPDMTQANYGIATALKVLIQAQIEELVNS